MQNRLDLSDRRCTDRNIEIELVVANLILACFPKNVNEYNSLLICKWMDEDKTSDCLHTVSIISRESYKLLLEFIVCIINSRQAPQGGIIVPSKYTEQILSISYSPFVNIVDIAFLSAHIPREQLVSIQIPV